MYTFERRRVSDITYVFDAPLGKGEANVEHDSDDDVRDSDQNVSNG